MAGLEEEQLLDALVADPNASAADLAKRFGVTPATIKRRRTWFFEIRLAEARGAERAIQQGVAAGFDETEARQRVKASWKVVSKACGDARSEAEKAGRYSELASTGSTVAFTEAAKILGLASVGSGKYGPTSASVEALIAGLRRLTKDQWSRVMEEGRVRHRQMVDPHWVGPRFWELAEAAQLQIQRSGRKGYNDLANADVGEALQSNADNLQAAIQSGRRRNAFDQGSGAAAEAAIGYALTGVLAKDLITTEDFGMLWLCFTGLIPMDGLPPEAANFKAGFDKSTKAMDKVGCAVLIVAPAAVAACSAGLLAHRLLAG